MKKYTKEQLIIAMHKWNVDYAENTDRYEENPDYHSRETAEEQVEHMLSFL